MNMPRIGPGERPERSPADSSQILQDTGHQTNSGGIRRPNTRRQLLSVPELEQIPEVTWLVQDLLAEKSLAVLYGPTGSYKTFVAIDLALSIASGREFAQRPTKKGAVAYICAEGQAGIKWRIRAWLKVNGLRDPQLWVVPAAVAFDEPDHIAELIYDLLSLPEIPSLIIVDTLARTFGEGDESNSRDMNRYLAAAEQIISELGTSVLLIHHSTKKANDEPRGSGALVAAADTVLQLESKSRFQATLSVIKQRDTDAEQEFNILLKHVEIEVEGSPRQKSSLVARAETGSRKAARR